MHFIAYFSKQQHDFSLQIEVETSLIEKEKSTENESYIGYDENEEYEYLPEATVTPKSEPLQKTTAHISTSEINGVQQNQIHSVFWNVIKLQFTFSNLSL